MEEMKKILDSLESVEKAMANTASAAELKSLQEQQNNLMAELKSVGKRLADVEQRGVNALPSAFEPRKSVGEQFVKSNSYGTFLNRQTRSVSEEIETKADATVMITSNTAAGTIQPYVQPNIVEGELRALTIESILPQITITSPSFTYTREKAFTNGAAFVAEGAAAPYSKVELEQVTLSVANIAHIAVISRILLEDKAALAGFINARMLYGVDVAVEDALINGDGSNNGISGLFKTGNFTAHGATTVDLPAQPNLIDLINLAATKVSDKGYRPTHVLLNPFDAFALSGMKDSTGRYLLDNALSSSLTSIRGLSVMTTQAIQRGKFLVLDPRNVGMIYNRSTLSIGVYEQDGDNVKNGTVTIRAERRLGLAVERPFAAVGGDLAVPAAPKSE